MDFLRGIPVEHKLETYNMPHTGPTLCPPKIGYVDLSVTPLSTLVPFSPLVHINGDNADSPPKIPDTQNYMVTLNTILHASSNTRSHINIPLRHFVSNTNKPKLESCSTISKPYSMLQIKNFLCCVVKEKFRHSLVLPKKYSVREIINFPNRYRVNCFSSEIADLLHVLSVEILPLKISWLNQQQIQAS